MENVWGIEYRRRNRRNELLEVKHYVIANNNKTFKGVMEDLSFEALYDLNMDEAWGQVNTVDEDYDRHRYHQDDVVKMYDGESDLLQKVVIHDKDYSYVNRVEIIARPTPIIGTLDDFIETYIDDYYGKNLDDIWVDSEFPNVDD